MSKKYVYSFFFCWRYSIIALQYLQIDLVLDILSGISQYLYLKNLRVKPHHYFLTINHYMATSYSNFAFFKIIFVAIRIVNLLSI